MRNAIDIGNGFIVTTDNSGGIGEKTGDVVSVPDRLTSYYAARVALLEQWASNAMPVSVLIHNFSGSGSWENYVNGVKDLFQEAGLAAPKMTGSTETNMELIQSAVAVTMIGKKKQGLPQGDLKWFTYGTPLFGNEVKEHADEIASVHQIHKAIKKGLVHQVWPVGSRGILEEVRSMIENPMANVKSSHDVSKSAGPATVVIIGIPQSKLIQAEKLFNPPIKELHITQ